MKYFLYITFSIFRITFGIIAGLIETVKNE